MRVSREVFRFGVYGECSVCAPPPMSDATLRAAAQRLGRYDEGDAPSWHNAVRLIEDAR